MTTICPTSRRGARVVPMKGPKDLVSKEPSMLVEAPIPSSVSEEMSATFPPQFLGALPCARSPFGARPWRGAKAMFVEDSSTNTSRLGSTPLIRSRKALRASSSRSVAASVFFYMSIRASLLWPGSSRRWTPKRPSSPPASHNGAQGCVVVLFELPIRSELGAILEDGDFAHLFPRCGQSAMAPWRLALVTITTQFAEELSDQQVANAVRARINWKYALSLALADSGFELGSCASSGATCWRARIRGSFATIYFAGIGI